MAGLPDGRLLKKSPSSYFAGRDEAFTRSRSLIAVRQNKYEVEDAGTVCSDSSHTHQSASLFQQLRLNQHAECCVKARHTKEQRSLSYSLLCSVPFQIVDSQSRPRLRNRSMLLLYFSVIAASEATGSCPRYNRRANGLHPGSHYILLLMSSAIFLISPISSFCCGQPTPKPSAAFGLGICQTDNVSSPSITKVTYAASHS